MTESDLRDARDSVDERIDSKRRRDRRRTIVAAAAAAVLIPALGVAAFQFVGEDDKSAPPANPGPSDPDADFLTGAVPTPELLEGVWRVDDGTTLLRFSTEGDIDVHSAGGCTTRGSTRRTPLPET